MAIMGRGYPNRPVVVRSTLQDDPVLTTVRSVYVIVDARSALVQRKDQLDGQIIFARSTLIDPPVLTTPAPIVAEQTQPSLVQRRDQLDGYAAVLRSSLVDVAPPAAATPQPIVLVGAGAVPVSTLAFLSMGVGQADTLATVAVPGPIQVVGPAPRPAGAVLFERGSLADDPVLTTASPEVVTGANPRPAGGLAFTSRSSLVDVVAPTNAGIQPIVIDPPLRPPPATVINERGTLADDPQLTTPAPIVITTPGVPHPAAAPYLSRSSFADVAVPGIGTPSPIVVAAAVKVAAAKPVVLRAHLVDPPVLITPGPIVIAAARYPAPTFPVVRRGTLTDKAPDRDITLTAAPLTDRWAATQLPDRWSAVALAERWISTPLEET